MADTDIAARLREAREYVGFRIEDITSRIGCDATVLQDLESGKRPPTDGQLAILARAYRRPVGWFTGEWQYQPPPDLLRKVENLTPGDREAILDFAEWLQGAGTAPKLPREALGEDGDD